MLNTWMGPGWVPTNTITNIIVAIQALVLNEEPLRNEPGYEHSCDDDIDKYNHIIQYANLKIAILDQLKTKNLGDFECFRNKINQIFLNNIDLYKNSFEKRSQKRASNRKPFLIFNKIDLFYNGNFTI